MKLLLLCPPFQIVLLISGALTHSLFAAEPALTIGGIPFHDVIPREDKTLGWEFTSTAPIMVTQLGLCDVGSDGLLESHQVSVWDLSGALLVQGTVPSRTTAPANGYFRYVDVPSTMLAPGNYIIAAQYSASGQDDVLDGMVISPSAAIRYVQARSGAGANLPFPDLGTGQIGGFFGPNFQLTVVPEPTTLAIGSLAMLVLWLRGLSSGKKL